MLKNAVFRTKPFRVTQLATACCGGDNQYCDPATGSIDETTGSITLPTPMQGDQPFCSPECSVTYADADLMHATLPHVSISPLIHG